MTTVICGSGHSCSRFVNRTVTLVHRATRHVITLRGDFAWFRINVAFFPRTPADASNSVIAQFRTTLKCLPPRRRQKNRRDSPDDNKKATISFQLTSSVKRSGTLAAGEKVAVTYYEEEGRNVVVELAGAKK